MAALALSRASVPPMSRCRSARARSGDDPVMTAFQQAGSDWPGTIGDPVTIRVDVAFDALPPGVLGSASSGPAPFGHPAVRTVPFATGFASSFVTDRRGGVPARMPDFNTVARHEIAHGLGFTSGVDLIDECADSADLCQLVTAGFHGGAWLMALDLFRYSAPGQRDARVGGSPYLSVDGGVTSMESFSSGVKYGNGWQASHFGTGSTNLMRAFISDGEACDATGNDLAALDAIGWDMAVAVPEPSTWVLMRLGVCGQAGWMRRRRA